MRASSRPTLSIVVAVLALGACTVYRPEIRQGNYMDESRTKQVVPGMSREQVEFLLGPPMVADPFHVDRWDYVFTLESPITSNLQLVRRFIVYFDGEKVREVKIIDD